MGVPFGRPVMNTVVDQVRISDPSFANLPSRDLDVSLLLLLCLGEAQDGRGKRREEGKERIKQRENIGGEEGRGKLVERIFG